MGSLLAGAAVGVAARRNLRPAVAGFVAFGLVGGWAAGRDALESDADRVMRAAISRLFREEKDTRQLIKLKAVYDLLELTTDKCQDVALVIGGSDGHAPAIRARATETLALSRLTLAHRLARLVLVEQLYRAMTILRGEPYHK